MSSPTANPSGRRASFVTLVFGYSDEDSTAAAGLDDTAGIDLIVRPVRLAPDVEQ